MSWAKPSPFLLVIYPVILAIGSLYAVAAASNSPPAHAEPMAPGISSDLNTPYVPTATSYFAGKTNVINLYFVKIGWFWTTLAFVLLQVTTPFQRTAPASSASFSRSRTIRLSTPLQSALRYTLITLSWILVTQWCFGPPLIDRSFTITGGHCEGPPANLDVSPSSSSQSPASPLLDAFAIHTSSTACKAAGGRWRGGHDISGHVFMLVLSSAFLFFEFYLSDAHSQHPTISPRAAANIASSTTELEKRAVGGWESAQQARWRIYACYFTYTVVALDLWMLLMTAVFFHTWLEKLNGLLLAAATVWTVYFLGDMAPSWRGLVGEL